ncbi:MAG: response regulator [Magnetococcales bacterium]|nr:response regulator [Magnetococcales bacterium]
MSERNSFAFHQVTVGTLVAFQNKGLGYVARIIDPYRIMLIAGGRDATRDFISRWLLKDSDYRLHQIDQSSHVLARIDELRPEVILMDLDYLGAQSIALLKQMRTALMDRVVPIIVLSSPGREEYRWEAMLHGAKDHISKPPNRHDFMLRLRFFAEQYQDAQSRMHPSAAPIPDQRPVEGTVRSGDVGSRAQELGELNALLSRQMGGSVRRR